MCVAGWSYLAAGCAATADEAGPLSSAARPLVTDAQICLAVQRGTSGSVEDATLWHAAPTWNDSTSAQLSTGTSQSGGSRRTLIRHELPQLPEDATVVSGTLSVYQLYKEESSAVSVHRVIAPWSEPTVTDASFGDGFDPAAEASFTADATIGFRAVDLTQLSRAWASGAASNHGVLLEEAPVARTSYRSSESPYVAQRPKLEICYVTCSDGVTNGLETAADCGGGCAPCADGLGCAVDADCASGTCAGGVCQAEAEFHPGTWTSAGSMAQVRWFHAAAALPDGGALAVGGDPAYGGPLRSAERYDPATNAWTATPLMAVARSNHRVAVLQSGRVMASGGYNWNAPYNAAPGYGAVRDVEIYDPATNTWTAAASLGTHRWLHTIAVLLDGRVLVAGGLTRNDYGATTAAVEIYEPVAATWTPAPPMLWERRHATATTLLDGRVLVAGGRGRLNGGVFTGAEVAELYDPATNTWSATGPLVRPRENHAAVRLQDGRVLIVGGWPLSTVAQAEIYDPATNAWTEIPGMAVARYEPGLALLPGGRVLIASGSTTTGESEILDPATGTFSPGPAMAKQRWHAAFAQLASGHFLVAGGWGGAANYGSENGVLSSAELYTPGAP